MKKLYPIYYNKKSPCYSIDHLGNGGCPARNDIARFIYSISVGDFLKAFNILKETNPFSGGCGRFCDHPCETACNRAKFDSAVDIKYLERFASDYGFKNNILAKPVEHRKNKSIAVIGSGPAGLSSAYFLARAGYDVIVYERHKEAGGILFEGIPPFRYPFELRDYEINYIKSFGVDIRLDKPVDWGFLKSLIKEHDAIVIATGAQKARSMGISGDNLSDVKVGLEFLRNLYYHQDFKSANYNGLLKSLEVGKDIAIIGGGYTAFDVARSSIRLGANPSVYYRRSMTEMTAHPGEVDEAKKEGIDFSFLTAPTDIKKLKSGKLQLSMERMRLGDVDSSGRRRPVPIKGSIYQLEVDTVITAIGETPDLSFITSDYRIEGYNIFIDALEKEDKDKLFITGDALQGNSGSVGMVVRAVGASQDTAIEVRNYLGENLERPKYNDDVAFYDTIKKRYFPVEARLRLGKLSIEERKGNFKEVDLPLSDDLAMSKASRCWNCGICIQCDWCRDYANESILKLSKNWNAKKDSHFYKFIKEKVSSQTKDSVTGCPRNAMAIVPYDNNWKDIVDKQYISYDDIAY